MDDDRKRFLRRRTVGSFSENLSFYPEKDNLSWNHASLDPDEIEKIINISLSGNLQDPHHVKSSNFQLPSQPCQTTINLYINDPHMLQKNWDKYRKTPPRRKLRNEIVLGKSIPDHTLMKDLLGDLGVKKFSSAPNMTNKCLNTKRNIQPSEVFCSERSLTDSSEVQFKDKFGEENTGKGTKLLYVNDRKSGGDFVKNIGRINEEEEDKEIVEENMNNKCRVHSLGYAAFKVQEDVDAKKEQLLNLKDPLKRFKRKPFRASQVCKNPAILYRDMLALKPIQHNPLEQPKRTLPSFQVRTKMVKDILHTNPQVLHNYQSGLMKNHKRLFDSLRHKNFLDVVDENRAEKEHLVRIKASGKIDQISVEQSKLILSGKNRRPICSAESHGSYEEYKKNLVEAPDGTLCCRNFGFIEEEDDVWTRSETRNMITTEFVKDKVKKFDKLLNKTTNNQSVPKNDMQSICGKSHINRYQIVKFPFKDTLSHNILNEESVSFPRETKNAMTRLMSKRSKMYMDEDVKETDKKIFATLSEIKKISLHRRNSSESSTSYEDGAKKNVLNSGRCWPEVAERVLRSSEERNNSRGVNCRRSGAAIRPEQ